MKVSSGTRDTLWVLLRALFALAFFFAFCVKACQWDQEGRAKVRQHRLDTKMQLYEQNVKVCEQHKRCAKIEFDYEGLPYVTHCEDCV